MISDQFKNRWLIVSLIWIPVFILSYWNLNKMDSIRNIRGHNEVLLRDGQFWKQNAGNIKQVLEKHAALVQTVESIKLGLFDLEIDLKTVTQKIGLHEYELTSQPELAQNGFVPITIFFKGTFKQALQWYKFLENDLPYAHVKRVKVKVDPIAKQAKFDILIHYRYNLSE
jgi:hypothetical protein